MKASRFQNRIINKIIQNDFSNKKTLETVIEGQILDDYRIFSLRYGYTGIQKLKSNVKLVLEFTKIYWLLVKSLVLKRCYIGTFNGEFGNFLSYVLPFLNYLYSKGVKINYCGLELYEPFMVDESGKLVVSKFTKLPDFYHIAEPTTNATKVLPELHQEIIKDFYQEAKQSKLPFWNLNDDFFYFHIYRNWILKGPFMKTFKLEKVYKTKSENSVVIFPRKKKGSPNVGEGWDYNEIIDQIKHLFDKIYVLGHPSLSVPIEPRENVEVLLTTDNRILLEKCSNSKLIINQHSGTKYLGEYTDTQVLIIYKGNMPIVGIMFNLVFNFFLGQRHCIHFAFSLEEIKQYCKNLKKDK